MAGGEKRSHVGRGKLGDHWESRGSKTECGQVSPVHLGILGLILCPPGPLQPCRSGGSGREGRGSQSKGWTSGTSTPEGWLGEGRSSYTQREPPTVRGPVGMGSMLGVGAEAEEWKGTRPVFSLST